MPAARCLARGKRRGHLRDAGNLPFCREEDLAIYARVSAHSPGLIPDKVPEESNSERGRKKKQRLLAYLREHPEELRPAVI